MKSLRPFLLPRPLVIVCLVAGLFLTAGTAVLSVTSTHTTAAAGIHHARTSGALLQINRLLIALSDVENARQHTGISAPDAGRQRPRTPAVATIHEHLNVLEPHVKNTAAQRELWTRLQTLTAIDHAAWDTAAIRDTVLELERSELAVLASSAAGLTRRASVFHQSTVVVLAVAWLLVGAGVWYLVRRQTIADDTLITVCAWTRRVKMGNTWVSFEEYLESRFKLQFTHGISEEAACSLRKESEELARARAEHPTLNAA